MSGRLRSALVLSAILAAGCWQLKPNHCDTANDCASHHCNMPTKTCVPEGGAGGNGGAAGNGGAGGAGGSHDAGAMDAPVPCTASSCTEVTKPICAPHDGSVAACEACTDTTQCTALGTSKPACKKATGACVPCVDNTTCAGTTPICDTATNTCTKCVSDSDCAAAPGVCMGDGHCASAAEVIFVQYSASVCPNANADGTMANPYCTLQLGVAALSSTRTALVVVGPAFDQLALATSGFSPLIVGRADSSPTPGSIPATAGTAIAVSSDNVTIRDLLVNAGTGTSTKGILVKGNGTKLSLTNVTVSLTNGLGIDAEAGATLTMNHCTVSNNKGGGIFLNGAAYDIEDTTVMSNGPANLNAISWGGVLVNAAPASGPSTLKSLTITNNLSYGLVCATPSVSGTADSVLLSNNTTGNILNCGSGIATCGDAGTSACGVQQ